MLVSTYARLTEHEPPNWTDRESSRLMAGERVSQDRLHPYQDPGSLVPRNNLPESESNRPIPGRIMWFFARRYQFGIWRLFGALAATVFGTYLLWEIPHAPVLVPHLLLLSSLSFLWAVWVLLAAYRDLFGGIRVDQEGLCQFPRFCGDRVRWSEVSAWRLPEDGRWSGSLQLQVWTAESEFSQLYPVAWLSAEDRDWLRCVLRQVAPETHTYCCHPEVRRAPLPLHPRQHQRQ